MKIYVIIVTYNAMRRNWIDNCLKSLEASTIPVTPIVIDNGSTDETRSFVPQHYPKAIWLPQEKNLGFGQANNVGLRYTLEHNGDYVLLLNQDATLDSEAIEKMIPLIDDHSLLSPIHLNGNASQLDANFKLCLQASDDTLLDDLLITKKTKDTYSGPKHSSGRVIPAACWFIPIAVIRKIGGFNPLFFHYSEDDNYFQRLYYHHINVKICPKATMYHDRGEHGSMKAFNKKRHKRLLLRAVTNVNYSLWSCVKEGVRVLMTCYFSELPKRQYIPGSYLIGLFWVICHLPQIISSRKKEKTNGPTWLV